MKRSAKGFSFKVPGWLKGSFRKYVEQFPVEAKVDCCFLKNMCKKKDGRGRIQNWGQNNLASQAKAMAVFLHLTGNFSAHSFRRSGATALAESGISVVGLCHAGRWKSLVTAQEYQEDTVAQKSDRASRMDASDEGVLVEYNSAKKQKVVSDSAEQSKAGGVTHNVTGNSYVININGKEGGHFSFLNGKLSALAGLEGSDSVGSSN